MGQCPMAILGYLSVPAIGQAANFLAQKFAAAGGLSRALLGFAGNANGRKFILIAIDPAGKPHTQRAGIELVGFAFAIERDGRDQKTLRARFHQPALEHETKAARFGYGINDQTFGDPFLHLED